MALYSWCLEVGWLCLEFGLSSSPCRITWTQMLPLEGMRRRPRSCPLQDRYDLKIRRFGSSVVRLHLLQLPLCSGRQWLPAANASALWLRWSYWTAGSLLGGGGGGFLFWLNCHCPVWLVPQVFSAVLTE
ncbi:hypothetical protein B0T26DRAFT_155847 [Lasiosphaeria miniovina]|uniref:Uncharacterized protein n=1 Tax=Lasiosphaeria miniovina TaxID=1954250 RepID=A0AA40B5H2_9PEZI|nr:uncharacterized protein B0T26DRAFT_155847 [Lasiosphaeria miniovina]KAK0728040.1 hypothetical protein B0T26DRAFT_155847 [Lasiosphaeria miniovina]